MFRMPTASGWVDALRGADSRAVLTVACGVLTAVLGLQTARLIWVLAVEPGGLGSPPAATAMAGPGDLSILSRFDAFFRGQPGGPPLVEAGAPSGEVSGGGFQLFGVRATGRGAGSAIIAGPDGRQVSVATGETIAPGVTLVSVAGDHAVIRRGGQDERIVFAPVVSALMAAAPPPAPVSGGAQDSGGGASAAADRSGVVNAIGLQPRRVDGRVNGFTLIPRGNASGLAAAGLRPGDVILTVNGLEVTVENQPELLQDLRLAPQAVIGFERDGQPMSVTLRNPGS